MRSISAYERAIGRALLAHRLPSPSQTSIEMPAFPEQYQRSSVGSDSSYSFHPGAQLCIDKSMDTPPDQQTTCAGCIDCVSQTLPPSRMQQETDYLLESVSQQPYREATPVNYQMRLYNTHSRTTSSSHYSPETPVRQAGSRPTPLASPASTSFTDGRNAQLWGPPAYNSHLERETVIGQGAMMQDLHSYQIVGPEKLGQQVPDFMACAGPAELVNETTSCDNTWPQDQTPAIGVAESTEASNDEQKARNGPPHGEPTNRHRHWTVEDDDCLRRAVEMAKQAQAGIQWTAIAIQLNRSGVQCQARWSEVLDPSIKKGRWSASEDSSLVSLHNKHGSSWNKIAERMRVRTQRQCRSRWMQLQLKKTDAGDVFEDA